MTLRHLGRPVRETDDMHRVSDRAEGHVNFATVRKSP